MIAVILTVDDVIPGSEQKDNKTTTWVTILCNKTVNSEEKLIICKLDCIISVKPVITCLFWPLEDAARNIAKSNHAFRFWSHFMTFPLRNRTSTVRCTFGLFTSRLLSATTWLRSTVWCNTTRIVGLPTVNIRDNTTKWVRIAWGQQNKTLNCVVVKYSLMFTSTSLYMVLGR